MIGSTHRFHGHGSLRYVYQHGRVVRHSQCLLRYAANNRRKTYRVAVVVSRKVHKSAVVRNRIRRRIYEVVREEGANITQPYDLAFIILTENIAELSFNKLQDIVRAQLYKAGVIQATPTKAQQHGIVKPKKKEF